MPDQLADRARKAAEEIYAWPRHWPQDREYRIISDEERLSNYAAIIERHWREHIESEKKMIRSGETPDGCNATGDCECHGKCYECDYFDDQHFVIRRGSMHKPQCSPRPAPPKGQGGGDSFFAIGQCVVFYISEDIEAIVTQRRELDYGIYDYLVSWMHNGDRKESWVNSCEIVSKKKEAAPCQEK